jgi:hypothetical protein
MTIGSPGLSLISAFLVATADRIHPSEPRSSALYISTVLILKAEYNAITFAPFCQKEFDDILLFVLDRYCHFSDSATSKHSQNLTGL